MVEVINIAPEYERVLSFLYPEYSCVTSLGKFSKFIIRREVTTKVERERLNYQYEDCVFISNRIFDEFWDEQVIKDKVLEFAKVRFGSRKRVLKTVNSEGSEFIDECVRFMFTGLTWEESESEIGSLFEAYGSGQFYREFLVQCEARSVGLVSSAMETFISKVVTGNNSVYYKRAGVRLLPLLRGNSLKALSVYEGIDPFYRKRFPELCNLCLYANLLAKS